MRYNVLVYPKFLRDAQDLGEHKPGDSFGYWRTEAAQEAKDLLVRLVSKEFFKGGKKNG